MLSKVVGLFDIYYDTLRLDTLITTTTESFLIVFLLLRGKQEHEIVRE
jgi:hypothetical protein